MDNDDEWRTTYLPVSEGTPQSFIRSKIGVDDKSGFNIAYLKVSCFIF